ncbi:MAG TPA: GNAT family N-acetyltransferase [Ktedonobacteraceae bacterium]|nr:GNAT family N-acetyltransferase [Ktedonobacteraceae bacterium]
MPDTEITFTAVEWKQARAEDAATWVSVSRQSNDQVLFESEASQLARYQEEGPDQQAQRYLLWCGETAVGRLRFFSRGQTAELDGLVLLPDTHHEIIKQVAEESINRANSLNVRHLKATYPAAYIAPFASSGFQELRKRTSMLASTKVTVAPIELPSSVRIRAIGHEDTERLGTLLQRAYAGGPDDTHPDLAGWRSEVRAIQEGQFGPFIPESCFVVENAQDPHQLAGAILVHLERGVPRIHHMAVAPLFRHIRLGQLLAVRSMQRLNELSYPQVVLNVTLGIPAVGLYRRLGFSEFGPTYIEAERKLR